MSYTEVTKVSWFSRLRESIKGVLVGLLLFALSFPLLYWNEGRAVRQAQALKDGGDAVVTISSEEVDPDKEGFLVHTVGLTKAGETLEDEEFALRAQDALRLERKAEIYQWKEFKKEERKKKAGGGEEHTTTYSYEKVWSPEPIDSSRFKKEGYDNPQEMRYRSQMFQAHNSTVGAFRLGNFVSHLKSWEKFPVSEGKPDAQKPPERVQLKSTETEHDVEDMEELPTEGSGSRDPFRNRDKVRHVQEKRLEAQAREQARLEAEQARLQQELDRQYELERQRHEVEHNIRKNRLGHLKPHDDGYYLGENPDTPELGDQRITFAVVRPGTVSLLAQQSGNGFAPYSVGKTELYRIVSGEQTAEEMFHQMEKENAQLTWILRGVGFFMMMIGLASIFKPFVVVADVIPLFGNLLGTGVGIFSFLLAAPLTLGTIAVGWFAARPLIAGGLLFGAGFFVYLAFKAGRKKKKK